MKNLNDEQIIFANLVAGEMVLFFEKMKNDQKYIRKVSDLYLSFFKTMAKCKNTENKHRCMDRKISEIIRKFIQDTEDMQISFLEEAFISFYKSFNEKFVIEK